jgi:hypothetical protein
MLHASLSEMDDTLDNKVVLKQCITLLSITIESIFIINYEFDKDILLKIIRFICDLMKIFYNEGIKLYLTLIFFFWIWLD